MKDKEYESFVLPMKVLVMDSFPFARQSRPTCPK
jgi:hypothetical protein